MCFFIQIKTFLYLIIQRHFTAAEIWWMMTSFGENETLIMWTSAKKHKKKETSLISKTAFGLNTKNLFVPTALVIYLHCLSQSCSLTDGEKERFLFCFYDQVIQYTLLINLEHTVC